MIKKIDKNEERLRRHARVRRKISGTAETPRMSVFRSLKHIYVQLIDDVKGVTLCSASTDKSRAARLTPHKTSSIPENSVKIGRAELFRRAPSSRAVKHCSPRSRTTSSAAAITSSFVNFAFGGITVLLNL